MNDIELRRHASTVVLRAARSPEFRRDLNALNVGADRPLIVVLESDTLGDVFGRIVDADPEPPALLAMFRPEHRRLVIWSIDQGDEGDGPEHAPTLPASSHATIGMLYDTIIAGGGTVARVSMRWPSRSNATIRTEELKVT